MESDFCVGRSRCRRKDDEAPANWFGPCSMEKPKPLLPSRRLGSATATLLGQELVEFPIDLYAAKLQVRKIKHRRPIILSERVTVFGVVHAETIGHLQKIVGRLGGQDRLLNGVGQRHGVGIALESDEWSWRAQC